MNVRTIERLIDRSIDRTDEQTMKRELVYLHLVRASVLFGRETAGQRNVEEKRGESFLGLLSVYFLLSLLFGANLPAVSRDPVPLVPLSPSPKQLPSPSDLLLLLLLLVPSPPTLF